MKPERGGRPAACSRFAPYQSGRAGLIEFGASASVALDTTAGPAAAFMRPVDRGPAGQGEKRGVGLRSAVS